MQYEIVVIHYLQADSHKEAELKYRDNDMDIDGHQIFWYDEEGNRHEIPQEAYNVITNVFGEEFSHYCISCGSYANEQCDCCLICNQPADDCECD